MHTHAPTTAPDPRRWWVLGLLAIAQAMLVIDVTVVNVALPSIGAELGLDRAALTWVVTAYTLFFGSLLLLGGRLADGFGRRRMFLIGIGTFVVASLASGLAPDGTILVAARAAQGIGAALMSPAALSIVTTTFAGAERTRALGVWAAVGGSGAAIGVALGGLLTSGPGWQWVFFVNVPIGIVVALGVARLIAPAPTTDHPRLDIAGAASVTTMFGALLIGLINAGDDGWIAPTTIVPLAVALGAGVVFALIERIVANPLVRLDRLAEAPLPGSLLMLLSAAGLLAGGFFLNTMYLQGVLGLTAFETGAAFIPVALAIVVGAQAAAHLLGRLGARAVGTVGFAIAAVGMVLLARIPVEGNVVVDVLPGFAASALGLGMVFVTGTASAFSRVAHEDAGLVSGLTNTAHELGFAIGVAVISTIGAASVGAPSGSIQGFSDAFLFAGTASVVAAGLALWMLPASRQAIEGHAFAH